MVFTVVMAAGFVGCCSSRTRPTPRLRAADLTFPLALGSARRFRETEGVFVLCRPSAGSPTMREGRQMEVLR